MKFKSGWGRAEPEGEALNLPAVICSKPFTCEHDAMKSRIKAAQMSFLCGASGLALRDPFFILWILLWTAAQMEFVNGWIWNVTPWARWWLGVCCLMESRTLTDRAESVLQWVWPWMFGVWGGQQHKGNPEWMCHENDFFSANTGFVWKSFASVIINIIKTWDEWGPRAVDRRVITSVNFNYVILSISGHLYHYCYYNIINNSYY